MMRWNRMRWNEETTIKFVRLYMHFECLWNFYNPNYRNKPMRDAAYARIVREMEIDGFGILEAKQKVKNLQSTYTQELRKIDKSRSNGLEGLYVPSLKWFTIMDTLLRNAKEKNDQMKLEYEEKEEAEKIIPCEVSITEVEEEYPTNSKRAKTDAASEDTMKEALHYMKTLTETVANRDEFTTYGEHVANRLRNCGRNKLELATAQRYIDEICFKLTMGEYRHQRFQSDDEDDTRSEQQDKDDAMSEQQDKDDTLSVQQDTDDS